MTPIYFALLALVASPIAWAAPLSLDNSTLLQNGQDAQRLNAEFLSLQQNATCNAGETACISGAFANCNGTAWQTQQCPADQQCFALPMVRNNGTFVACTSESSAQSIVSATGAQGGLVSTAIANSTVPFPIVNTTSSDQNTTSSGDDDDNEGDDDDCDSGDDNGDDDGGSTGDDNGTLTVTVTLPANGTATQPPQTQILPPAAASSLLSSLTASGSFSIVTVVSSSSAPSAPASSLSAANGAARNGVVGSSDGASSGTPSATIIQLTARPSIPTSTPIPTSDVGGYSY